MGINVGETLMGLVTTSGIYQYLTNPLALIMVAIACVLLYLAIVKQFEPLLLPWVQQPEPPPREQPPQGQQRARAQRSARRRLLPHPPHKSDR